jgi:CBS domain-containing protein
MAKIPNPIAPAVTDVAAFSKRFGAGRAKLRAYSAPVWLPSKTSSRYHGMQQMNARDVMTASVISVGPDVGTHELAKLLLDKGISGVPVVDAGGKPIGMVSESDLIGRGDSDQEARRDRWLRLLAEGELLNPEFLASLHSPDRRARDIMASPIVSVNEEAEVSEIARLLITHHIKRVPVVRDGQVVGIVSRVDLLRAIAGNTLKPTLEAGGTRPSMAIAGARRGSPRMRPPRKPRNTTL